MTGRRILSAFMLLSLVSACDSQHEAELVAGAKWWWDYALGADFPHQWRPISVEIVSGTIVLTLNGSRHGATEDLSRQCPGLDSYLWELVPAQTPTRIVLTDVAEVACPNREELAAGRS